VAIIQGTFIGIGELPQVISATSIQAGMGVRVRFSEDMNPSPALSDPISYAVTEDIFSIASNVVSVVVYSDYVELVLDTRLTAGTDNYLVTVDASLEDLVGNAMDPAALSAVFSGESPLPIVQSVASLAPEIVRVRFDRAMDPATVADPASYSIDPAPGYTVVDVIWATPEGGPNPTYVDLLLSGPVDTGTSNYSLTVAPPLPEDQSYNPLDISLLPFLFSGVGLEPPDVEDIYDGPIQPSLAQGATNKPAESILWKHLPGVMPK